MIFSQGDAVDALYGVASGQVRISSSSADGREIFLNIMEPGDAFGEISVIDGLPRSASATAIESAVLIVIQREPFLSLVAKEPQLALHLLQLFSERVRWTSELVEESAFLTAPARLAKRLLSLASLHGRPADSGMELRISQSELAHFLGLSRQIVNQRLQEWKAEGWVVLARGRIIVSDSDALQNVVVKSGLSSP
jgi:CRP-like cAMP-binding protein